MQREYSVYFNDIINAINKIEKYCKGMTKEKSEELKYIG